MSTANNVSMVMVVMLVLCGAVVAADDVEYRMISVGEYANKVTAGWVGQMVGVGYSEGTEFRTMGQIIPDNLLPEWEPEMVNRFDRDELYVEMTFLAAVESHGPAISPCEAGIAFANTEYPVWRGNYLARNNLRKGIAPPNSGHPKHNSHADDIDFLITSDFTGLLSPGLPHNAIAMGETFGRITAYGSGLHAGQFLGGMYAEAFFTRDPRRIVQAGLACVPEGGRVHDCISDLLSWHHTYPDDWKRVWHKITDKYRGDPKYKPFSATVDRLVAPTAAVYTALALLYGDGDPDATLAIATQAGCGMDSDFTASNAMGVCFTALGFSNLPARYTSALDRDARFAYSDYTLTSLTETCAKLAEEAVIRAGGSREKNSEGEDVFVIPCVEARPGALEFCWEPGSTADAEFTEEERSLITQTAPTKPGCAPLDMSDTVERFLPGWSIRGTGDDMVPGVYGSVRGKERVLLTHPLDPDTACVLSKRIAIPKAGSPRLRITAGHHPQGDWTLIVKVDGREILTKPIGPETSVNTWTETSVDLTAYAGKEVELELLNQPSAWAWEAACWAEIKLETK